MWYMCKMKYNTVKNDHLLTKEAQQKSPTGKKKKKDKRLEIVLHQTFKVFQVH